MMSIKKVVLALNALIFAAVIALDIALILKHSLLLKSLTSACFVLGGIVNTVYTLKAGSYAD